MIQFTDYDRITDTLMYLSGNISLKFTVALSNKTKDGARSFFHYETFYNSRYIGTNDARAIKRNIKFFFTLDNKNDMTNSFVIKPRDVYFILQLIENKIFPLYFGPKKIFSIVENKLYITGKYTPIVYAQSEYRYISFEPIVQTYEDGTFKEGVRINLNNKYDFADVDIDKFIELYYILKNTDMYSAACNLINYVKLPPYGINVYQQAGLGGGGPIREEDDWSSSSIENNTPQKSNQFFDNLQRKKG